MGPTAQAPALPLALTSFIGRERELDEIAALVRDHRMVTLTGAGGVGSTQTALHVGTALSKAGDVPVCFVGLAPITDPSLVIAAIASALSVQQVPNRSLVDTLVAFLKDKDASAYYRQLRARHYARQRWLPRRCWAGCRASSYSGYQSRTAAGRG